MTMTRSPLASTLILLLCLPACELGEKSIGNNDGEAATSGDGDGDGDSDNQIDPDPSSTSDSESDTETETGAELSCVDVTAAALVFIGDNNSCMGDADCVSASGWCYANATCGEIGLNTAHDADAWSEIHNQLSEACEDQCGADPCGATVSCLDGTCTMSL
jgi:hypothetical protein